MLNDMLDRLRHSKFFTDFTEENVKQMSSFLQAYRAEPGEVIIPEEDIDDFMLIIIEGRVNIVKKDTQGDSRPMSIVGPGATLGEMSMIDGAPRFATCTATSSDLLQHLERSVAV